MNKEQIVIALDAAHVKVNESTIYDSLFVCKELVLPPAPSPLKFEKYCGPKAVCVPSGIIGGPDLCQPLTV